MNIIVIWANWSLPVGLRSKVWRTSVIKWIVRWTVIKLVIESVRRLCMAEIVAVVAIERSIYVESIANCLTSDTLLFQASPFLFERTQFGAITVS